MSRLLGLFRKDKTPIWKQLAAELGGKFVPGKGFRGKDTVVVQEGNWRIFLDTYKKGKRPTKTRIRAPYVNRDSFQFRIFRKKAGAALRKKLGMQDVVVGFPDFDREFIIQGNDERKLIALFSNERIRQIIRWQPDIRLSTDTDPSWSHHPEEKGISELSFEVEGVIADLLQLEDLYNLFAEVLNHLCHIGSAYEDDPFLHT